MKQFYTAIGRFEKRSGGIGKHYPVVVIDRKEHILDFHEMVLWVIMNWRVLDRTQVENLYAKKLAEIDLEAEKDCIVYIELLRYRGLITLGVGETDADAMYYLFGSLYITPLVSNVFIKIKSFFELTLRQNVSFRIAAREIFRKSSYTANEKRVLDLSRQNILSTAELMKCVEENVTDISDDSKLTDVLFTDDYTTSDNLFFTAKNFKCQIPVLEALVNLYMRKQIHFTRVTEV
jgi:hypothetical protein